MDRQDGSDERRCGEESPLRARRFRLRPADYDLLRPGYPVLLPGGHRQEGSFLQPLVFAGRTISEININEYIPAVQTFFAGKPLLRKNTFHAEKEINYAHLETLAPPLAGADTVVFVISRNRFSAREPLAQRTSLLIYNIYTGMVSVEPNTPHSRYYVPL